MGVFLLLSALCADRYPTRILATRSGPGGQRLGAGAVLELQVGGVGGVPGNAAAVVNFTVANPAGTGYVTVYPCGVARPVASNRPYIDTPWPPENRSWFWESYAIPVPLNQIHTGTNTLIFKSTDASTTVANISIILVAAAPVT